MTYQVISYQTTVSSDITKTSHDFPELKSRISRAHKIPLKYKTKICFLHSPKLNYISVGHNGLYTISFFI